MIATYRNTSLSSPLSPSELDTQISVRPSEAEEADQRLVRHTLNLINGYKNILVRTIETDILVLVISYIGKVELNGIEIYAYLTNSGRCYSIKQIIRELGSDIFLALPFFYAFTEPDTVSSFYGKGKCKAYDVSVKRERKVISQMFLSSLAKTHQCNIQSHWHTCEFCVAAIRIKTWYTRCSSTGQIREVYRRRLAPTTTKQGCTTPTYLLCFLSSWVFVETVCRRTRYSWPWTMALEYKFQGRVPTFMVD